MAVADKPVSAEKLSPEELAAAIEREPLVNVTQAAKLVGVPRPNFHRDFGDALSTVKITVRGAPSYLYFESEVKALARRRRQRARSNGRR